MVTHLLIAQHTEELRDSLGRVGHLLTRPSLLKLVTRILNPAMLPAEAEELAQQYAQQGVEGAA